MTATPGTAALTHSGHLQQRRRRDPPIVERAVQLVSAFNPITQTIASFCDDRLGHREDDENAPSEAVFLRQVLYGCVRCKEALKIFLAHMFSDLAASIERADYTLYMVLSYLLLFRLDELGFEHFKQVTADQDPLKICSLLGYVADHKKMQGALTQDWLSVYDLRYINDTMLGALERSAPAIAEHCTRLQLKSYGKRQRRTSSGGGGSGSGSTVGSSVGGGSGGGSSSGGGQSGEGAKAVVALRPATVVQPFNLTKPNPRRVPEPMKIEATFTTGREPRYLQHAKDLHAIAEEKAARRDNTLATTMHKYQEAEAAGKGAFKLHETRNTLDQKRKEVEALHAAELQFSPRSAKPAPQYPEGGAEVRLNVGAILREDALLKKKQAEDARLIKAYESELRDSTEFNRWQASMRERDAVLKREQTERKRQAAKDSAAAAQQALLDQVAANAELVGCVKQEKAVMAQQRKAEEDLRLMMARHLVKDVTQVRETAPRAAVQRTLALRKEGKLRLVAQLEDKRHARAQEAAQEANQVAEGVLKLRGEEVHDMSRRVKVFDPTESSGLKLLNEMSLAETRERLAMNELRDRQEQAERRRQIISDKAAKQEDLQKRLAGITRARAAAAEARQQARARLHAQEAHAKQREQAEHESKSAELLTILERQRAQRDTEVAVLATEEADRRKAALYLGAAAAGSSARALQDLQRGAERAERQRATKAMAEAQTAAFVADKAQAQAATNTAKARKAQARAEAERRAHLAHEAQRCAAVRARESAAKARLCKDVAAAEYTARRTVAQLNAYADDISHFSVATARVHRHRQEQPAGGLTQSR